MRRWRTAGIGAVVLLVGTAGLAAQSDGPASPFLDPEARALLEGVRARRAQLDSTIASYRTVVTERISVGLRALWRDRLLFRRELALRLHWRRDGPSRVDALGARQVTPIATTEIEVPDASDLSSAGGDFLFHPGRDRLLPGLEGGDALRHPFAPGAEAHYRYETGDTTVIRLPEGRPVRLIELRVHARRNDFDLVAGSFWLDAETHDVARAVYRPARPFDLFRDLATLDRDRDRADDEAADAVEDGTDPPAEADEEAGEDDADADDDIGWIPGVLRPIRGELKSVVVEYGLWEMKWWLPRLVSVEMAASVGNLLHTPASYERAYAAYEVAEVVAADTGRAAPAVAGLRELEECPDALDPYEAGRAGETEEGESDRPAPERDGADSAAVVVPPLEEGERWGCRCREGGRCTLYVVGGLPDSIALRTSELLPPSIYGASRTAATEAELEEFGRIIASLPRTEDRWMPPRLEFDWGLGAPGLVRYNRVEGLSVGARLQADVGRARADLTARIGSADHEPNAVLGLESAYYASGLRLAAYRRLQTANHGRGALGLGNSVFALAFGRDDGDYYRTLGLELTRSANAAPSAIDWRVFAERETGAAKSTDFSLYGALRDGHSFRHNFIADDAEQIGIAATLRHSRGLDAGGFRWGVRTRARGATGTFEYGRGAVGLWTTIPLPGDFVGALEAEAGAGVGDMPVQSLWRLGGPGTLRGFGGSAAVGEAFWRTRAELATAFPGARIGIFGDAAWAGSRAAWGTGRPLVGVGAGASVLDGIIRVDLAHALEGGDGWRFAIYLGGLL